MDYKVEYEEFIKWITDPAKCGLMGPAVYTKEEDAFALLFVTYLNCRYPPTSPNNAMHSDGQGSRSCEICGRKDDNHFFDKKHQ